MPFLVTSSALEQALVWSLKLRMSMPRRLLSAALIILMVAVARAALGALFLPFLFYIPAVLGVTLMLGAAPGLFGAFLSVAATLVSYQMEQGRIDAERWTATILYSLVMLMLIGVAYTLRRIIRNLHAVADRRDLIDLDREAREAELKRAEEAKQAALLAEAGQLAEAQRQQRLLNDELSHRLKNQLAVVQSIVSQTLRGSDVDKAARIVLEQRLRALGKASDVLTRSSWEAADLEALCRGVLEHVAEEGRVRIQGDPALLVQHVVMPLALVLHELATNAVKYGALSNATGLIDLSWKVEPSAEGEPHFQLQWREHGGPEVVKPTQNGFGTKLIEESLKRHFGGAVVVDYRSDGLVFEITSPTASVVRVGS
ncbi:HWE histidine kinase domain-containing protein [Brevundimonas sp. PAMC22021]|uniref:HWE histidine kinase domain-containing protein n=1 Tax=Brevundimonas sp. PAMC22021 TaxID=2861285 RepID=UPI001C62A233|nr:HWE histidine kinase domain-containing protein [Brevundimonas sp. PAMC22021]QYF87013.1 hypothetical protein KY493_00335 [Brevundimonas sp. PAMC22021]